MDRGNSHAAPQYVVYCDESCHELTPHHAFMTIGGIWLPRPVKPAMTRALVQLRERLGLRGEVKWRKTSRKRLEDYKQLVDFFFASKDLSFRSIVVEQTRIRMNEFHGADRELAFYKFYYEMLEKWLRPGCDYLILLDRKKNRGADRCTTLKLFLERRLRGKGWIHDLTIIDSRQTPLAQLCDLFAGAVAASYNGLAQGSAKAELAEYVARSAGLTTLRVGTSLTAEKLNIFRISLD